MCKEHIKAINQVLKNSRKTLPVLQCLAHQDGKLMATDLTVMVQVDTPNIADGIWKSTALDYGFSDETKSTEFTLDDYPELDLKEIKQEIELTSEDLKKILFASKFVSKDLTRPILTGVAIKGHMVYASDGYRMYKDRLSNELSFTIIFPSECLKVLTAVAADKRNWTLTLYENDQVALKSGNFTLYSKLIDGRIPEYDMLCANNTTFEECIDLDLKSLTIPKGYYIRLDRVERKLYLYNQDTKEKITVGTDIPTSNGQVDRTDKREIVMAMIGDKEREVIVDPNLLKPYGKKHIKLYANTKSGFVDIKVLDK